MNGTPTAYTIGGNNEIIFASAPAAGAQVKVSPSSNETEGVDQEVARYVRGPAHRWVGTGLQFRNPSGEWGTLTDLRGAVGPMWPAPTKADVGLPNVDNTSDANKPVSTAQAAAIATGLAGKVNNAVLAGLFFIAPYLTDLTGTNDQAANIATGLAAAGTGAVVIWPAGVIRIDSGVTLNNQRWLGAGAHSAAGTTFKYTSASGVAVTMLGAGSTLDGFRFVTTQSISTATAVQMSNGIENPRSQRVENVSAVGFQDHISILSGEFWSICNFDLYNPARYGVYVRNLVNGDSGDGHIHTGAIYADNPIGVAAIRFESGGGLKITGTKALQFARGLDVQLADGVATSDLLVANSSFENQTSSYSIRLGRIAGGTTGYMRNILISAQCVGGVEIYPGVAHISISGDYSYAAFGVRAAGGDGIVVEDGTTFFAAGYAGVDIQDPSTNVRIGQANYIGCAADLIDERVNGAGPVSREYVRPITLAPSAVVSLHRFDLQPGRGCNIAVTVEGETAAGGGVGSFEYRMFLARSGMSIVSSPVPTFSVGVGPTVTFDTASTPGAVIVKITNPFSGAGQTFKGSVGVSVKGNTSYAITL